MDKGPSIKDVYSAGEGGGYPWKEMGGGTLFRAKETSFISSKKEEYEIFNIFSIWKIFWSLLIIKNKSITNFILHNDGMVLYILDMIFIIFKKGR